MGIHRVDDFKDKGTISPSGWGKIHGRAFALHAEGSDSTLGPTKKEKRKGKWSRRGGEGERRVYGDSYFKKKM